MKILKEGSLPIKECSFCKSSLEYSKEDIIEEVWHEIDFELTICRHKYYIKCPKCSNTIIIKLTGEEINDFN